MKYLSPEIEAWSKDSNTKSLIQLGKSCGIFQDCNVNEDRLINHQQEKNRIKSK